MRKPSKKAAKSNYDELKEENIKLEKSLEKIKQVEARLSQKETYLRAVIENLPFDVFAIDKNGRYSMQNSTCKKNWGDVIGKRPQNIQVDKETAQIWEENNNRAFAGETVEGEVVMRPHGIEGHYYNIISPIHDNECISGILGVNIDITKRKLAEKALRESEEKFRSLTEQSPNMIFINKKGKVVYCNKKCEEIMGYSKEDFCSLDFDFLDLISEESKNIVKSAFEKHMKNQEVPPYEYRLVAKDGVTHDAIITTKLIRYEGDSAILGIVTDITQRKKMEEALRDSEAKFRALAESAPAAIIIVAGEKFVYVNPAFESISGYTAKEANSMRFWDLIHPDMQGLVKNRGMARQRGEAVPTRYELRTLTKEGQEKWIDVSATSLDCSGQTATLAIAYDITDRKQAEESLLMREQELADRAGDLEEVNAALRVLLKKRENDKVEFEDNIQFNINQLIEPYIDDLLNTQLTSRQATLLRIIKTNLDEIVSHFSLKFASVKYKLTAKEIKIAHLIRQGETTKSIAALMGLSCRTIEFHRSNIRNKLGLKDKTDNLQTHLLSLV